MVHLPGRLPELFHGGVGLLLYPLVIRQTWHWTPVVPHGALPAFGTPASGKSAHLLRISCSGRLVELSSMRPFTHRGIQWEGGFRGANFCCSMFRVSNSCQISHNFQAAVRNKMVSKLSKIACRTVAFATRSALADGLQSNSVGMKPLAIDSSLCCTVVHSSSTVYGSPNVCKRRLTVGGCEISHGKFWSACKINPR